MQLIKALSGRTYYKSSNAPVIRTRFEALFLGLVHLGSSFCLPGASLLALSSAHCLPAITAANSSGKPSQGPWCLHCAYHSSRCLYLPLYLQQLNAEIVCTPFLSHSTNSIQIFNGFCQYVNSIYNYLVNVQKYYVQRPNIFYFLKKKKINLPC